MRSPAFEMEQMKKKTKTLFKNDGFVCYTRSCGFASAVAHPLRSALTAPHGIGGGSVGRFGPVQRSAPFVQDQLVGLDEDAVLRLAAEVGHALDRSIVLAWNTIKCD